MLWHRADVNGPLGVADTICTPKAFDDVGKRLHKLEQTLLCIVYLK